MTLLFAVLGTAGLSAVALVLAIMARLTQRWELVTGSRSYYNWFYVSAGLLSLAAFSRLVRAVNLASDAGPSALTNPWSWLYVLLYHIPLLAGATISIYVVWRNWGWLLREQSG
jgi:hypothetical protein